MEKEIHEQPAAVERTLLGHFDGSGIVLDEQRLGEEELRTDRQGLRRRLRHRLQLRPGRQVRDRALDPAARRGRTGQRVPLPGSGSRSRHAGHRHQPVRRDGGYAGGGPPRPRAEGSGPGGLQHQRVADPPRIRRRALHPRRPGDRRRGDQDLPGPGHRELPGRAWRSRRPAAPRYRDEIAREFQALVPDAGGRRDDTDADGPGP